MADPPAALDPERYGDPASGPSREPGYARRYDDWMGAALDLAASCTSSGDVPVGAVVMSADGVEVGRGRNVREADADPTGHAEVQALRAAGMRQGRWRLDGCTLVVTIEPCAMCAGAAVAARLSRIVFGAWDPKAGACGSVWDLPRDRMSLHVVEVVPGVRAAQAAALMQGFFAARRR